MREIPLQRILVLGNDFGAESQKMADEIARGKRRLTARCRARRLGGTPVWRVVLGGALVVVWLLSGLQAEAQRVVQVGAHATAALLPAEDGRAIVDMALEQVAPLREAWDCSHVVHAIYASAGYTYPYASSSDIYFGSPSFLRVTHPRAGDVIAWRGHVGIVVDPAEHSFYSLVRTGLQAQNYESAYWRSRGQPRFYRLRVGSKDQPSQEVARNNFGRRILSEDK